MPPKAKAVRAKSARAMPPATAAAARTDDARFYNRVLIHDVTNLATGLSMQLELAQRIAGSPPAVVERLRAMQAIVGRLNALVRNVQVLADPGPKAPLQTLDAHRILDDVVPPVLSLFPRTKAQVHAEIPPGPLFVTADPSLEQMFFNLVMNAVFHNPAGEPQVWLQAGPGKLPSGPAVEVLIADDGPGLPEKAREALRALPGQEGPRVGLQAAAAIVKRLGGTIEAEDRVPGQPGQGTAFRVTLPAPEQAEP